jgi:hypothetical protein
MTILQINGINVSKINKKVLKIVEVPDKIINIITEQEETDNDQRSVATQD